LDAINGKLAIVRECSTGKHQAQTELEAKKSGLREEEEMNEKNECVGGHRPHGEGKKVVSIGL
jgi:hypothetical protein